MSIGIATALIGLAGGLISGLLGGYLTAKSAVGAWRRSRHDAAASQAVAAVKDLATELARASHNACWLTWKAKYDSKRLIPGDMDRYDLETHESFPKLFGAQAALAAIDSRSASITSKAVGKIAVLDAEIGLACVGWRENDKDRLANLYEDSLRVEQEVMAAIQGTAARILTGSLEQTEK